jgi:hypothetical protein
VRTLNTGEPTSVGGGEQALAAGTEVGEYVIEAQLGKGGFGTVYRGAHPLIGKLVAIKVLARKYSADPDVVSRFVAEARAVNQIRHRNIIDIFSFGQLADGRHYYVMEYLDGETLDACLRDRGAMPLDAALPILRAIARALDAAHAKGIAHRDLKPENVFLATDPDGVRYPKLLDFGIAKLLAPDDDIRHKTGTGVPIGTPYYMSPEQCRGRAVDHRTDIYSFGILAYRTLTASYPFEGDDYMELLIKQTKEDAPPPSSRNPALPPVVDAAIAWMMAKDPAQRPSLVIEGVAALDPTGTTRPTPPTKPPPIMARSAELAPAVEVDTADALGATSVQAEPIPGALSMPDVARRRSRAALWIGGALVLVAGAVGAVALVGRSSDDTKRADTGPNSTAGPNRPIAPVIGTNRGSASGGSAEPTSPRVEPAETVQIEITGTPAHTKVKLDGRQLDGEAPGSVAVPRGSEVIVLELDGDGYHATQKVTPDANKPIRVDGPMRATRPRTAPRPPKAGDEYDPDEVLRKIQREAK